MVSSWDMSMPSTQAVGPPWWGPQTSAVKCVCQVNSASLTDNSGLTTAAFARRYIAEFFNTLSSLFYVAYGIHGIQRYKRRDVGVFSSPNLSYWALIGVGIFSGVYHTSLKYYTQMSDELSMHLAIGTLLHQLFTFQEPLYIQRRNTAIILGVLVPFVIYHCVTDEFLLHVILFFCMSWIVALRTRYLISTKIKGKQAQDRISSLVTLATWTALTSYGIWNIDVHFCEALTRLKHMAGKPWDIFLELHAYWHLGTAVSAYCFMSIVEFLLSPEDVESHGVGFAWPARRVLQDIKPSVGLGGRRDKLKAAN